MFGDLAAGGSARAPCIRSPSSRLRFQAGPPVRKSVLLEFSNQLPRRRGIREDNVDKYTYHVLATSVDGAFSCTKRPKTTSTYAPSPLKSIAVSKTAVPGAVR